MDAAGPCVHAVAVHSCVLSTMVSCMLEQSILGLSPPHPPAVQLQAMVGDVITLLLVKCKQRPSFCQEYALDTSSVQLYTSRCVRLSCVDYGWCGGH
jgi:hypothetical protein